MIALLCLVLYLLIAAISAAGVRAHWILARRPTSSWHEPVGIIAAILWPVGLPVGLFVALAFHAGDQIALSVARRRQQALHDKDRNSLEKGSYR